MIIFFGSSSYSIPVLEALAKKEKIGVVTTPDKPAGRGQKITPNPLAQWAEKKKLPLWKFASLNQKTLEKLKKATSFTLGVCCVYGKIIPPCWLNAFSEGILNIHPSLLPKYRGSAPVPFAILRGERETGLTIIKMDEKCDHGPIIYQKSFPLSPRANSDEVYRTLFSFAGTIISSVIRQYRKKKITPLPQNHSQATFTRRLKKADGFVPEKAVVLALKNQPIPFQTAPSLLKELFPRKKTFSPLFLTRLFRALSPWPGLFTEISFGKTKKRLKLLQLENKKGKVFLEAVQLEGKRPVTFSQFSSAYQWPPSLG